jgi:hypothetical protein
VQLLKNFPAVYGTTRFIIVFIRALPAGPDPERNLSIPDQTILSL